MQPRRVPSGCLCQGAVFLPRRSCWKSTLSAVGQQHGPPMRDLGMSKHGQPERRGGAGHHRARPLTEWPGAVHHRGVATRKGTP